MAGTTYILSKTLPADIFDLQHEEFYDFVESHCGSIQASILKFQLISDAITFIECDNPTEVMEYDSEQLKALKEIACLVTNDGTYITLPGIVASFKTLKKRLVKQLEDDVKEARKTRKNIFNSSSSLSTPLADQSKSVDQLRTHLINSIKQWFHNHRDELNLKDDSDMVEGNDYRLDFTHDRSGRHSAAIICNCGTKSTLNRPVHDSFFQVSISFDYLQCINLNEQPIIPVID